jgi:vancomycin resistance protein YoaR
MPAARVGNLVRAAGTVNGVALPPDAIFSYNRYLGPVTAEAGYDMAHFTVPRTGEAYLDGGVAEAATAVFRAAIWGGLGLLERHPLPFRLGWLEPPVGLDATVSPADEVDLQFVNDTGGYLVISAEVLPERGALQVAILGTAPPERRVALDGPRVTGLQPAAGAGTLSLAGLPPGTRVQAGWAREGAQAQLLRVVVDPDGNVRYRDPLSATYRPAGDVFVVP